MRLLGNGRPVHLYWWASPTHTHTHTHTRTHAHARAHTHTHTHTHSRFHWPIQMFACVLVSGVGHVRVFVLYMRVPPVNELVRSQPICHWGSFWVGYKYRCSNCQRCQSSPNSEAVFLQTQRWPTAGNFAWQFRQLVAKACWTFNRPSSSLPFPSLPRILHIPRPSPHFASPFLYRSLHCAFPQLRTLLCIVRSPIYPTPPRGVSLYLPSFPLPRIVRLLYFPFPFGHFPFPALCVPLPWPKSRMVRTAPHGSPCDSFSLQSCTRLYKWWPYPCLQALPPQLLVLALY